VRSGWIAAELRELVDVVIGGDWGESADAHGLDYVDVLCIRGTELRDWQAERGRSAVRRKIKKTSLVKRQLKEGDLILEVSGGGPEQPVGRVELIDAQVFSFEADIPRVCTNFFRKIELNASVDPAYVSRYLKFFYATGEITKYQAGSNNLRNLKYSDYETISVPVAPLNEQRRIVEKIETLFARLDQGEAALRHTQTLLARYRQSVLKAAVTGALTADWRAENAHRLEHGRDLLARILQTRRQTWQGRGKYQEPAAPDTSNLPELPEGWVWATVEQTARVIGGLTKNSKRLEMPLRKPMLRVANVYQNRLDLSEIHETGVSASECERVLLESLDLLVVEGNGSKDQIGRMAIWRNEIPGAVHQNHLIKIRMVEKGITEFAMRWFQSPGGRQKVEEVASSTSGLHTLSISKIEGLIVPIPSLGEIAEINERVDETFSKITHLENWCQTELTRSAALRQSILKDAFAGKLVPQDPTDEPAADLLARIRASRPAPARKKARA
jgi:type I restriction enzyme, S subunit